MRMAAACIRLDHIEAPTAQLYSALYADRLDVSRERIGARASPARVRHARFDQHISSPQTKPLYPTF